MVRLKHKQMLDCREIEIHVYGLRRENETP